jgi:hypothetical protein
MQGGGPNRRVRSSRVEGEKSASWARGYGRDMPGQGRIGFDDEVCFVFYCRIASGRWGWKSAPGSGGDQLRGIAASIACSKLAAAGCVRWSGFLGTSSLQGPEGASRERKKRSGAAAGQGCEKMLPLVPNGRGHDTLPLAITTETPMIQSETTGTMVSLAAHRTPVDFMSQT